MKYRTLCKSTLLVLSLTGGLAQADIVLDVPFENSTIWSSSGGWYTTSMQERFYDNPINPEGNSISHSNPQAGSGNLVSTSDISSGTLTLQAGQYTLYYASGNWNNRNFSDTEVNFAGMSKSIATFDNSPIPGSGQWSLWSYTWNVSNDSEFIGNALSFSSLAVTEGNSAMDGVGYLSDLGDGFLVDYTAPASNASINDVSINDVSVCFGLGALVLGLTGAGGFRRDRKKSLT
jgi:hypothetical protein